VLFAAFGGLVFDGVELGLMPIASLSVTQSLLGGSYTTKLGGDWFAWFTASLMLGAAVGGIWFGALGDRIGRTKALGVSILFYSLVSGIGMFVTSIEQMLVLRFFVGLGVGGVWPNGVALVSECWPNVSRPIVAGIMGAGINTGILILSQIAKMWHITPDSWRWLFGWSAVPALLGIATLWAIPESPRWLAQRSRKREGADDAARQSSPAPVAAAAQKVSPVRELFRPPLLRTMLTGIILGAIPLVGAWAASKWMIPWADKVGGAERAGYKAATQQFWAIGAVLGSFFGAQLASLIGRRTAYFLISLGSTVLTFGIFTFTAPLRSEFLWLVLCQGFVATLFFGWLPLYLPELFPTRVRATGSGIAYNVGRFATAVGVLFAGGLVGFFGGNLAKVGAIMSLIYALGMIAIWWAPDTSGKTMDD
jgi:MFS family permease